MYKILLLLLTTTGIMPVSEVKPGMKAFAITVLKGTKIDTFDVEIVDIMKNYLPKCDLFLGKIYGPKIAGMGIPSGVSGSPVYFKNTNMGHPATAGNEAELIGAVSYSFVIFPREDGYFVGITPIENMLNPPSTVNNKGDKKSSLSPIKLSFTTSANCDSVLKKLADNFSSLNIVKIDGSNSERQDSIIPFPGSALGIPLVTGDATYSVIGTCTYKKGNKVWGFGHSSFDFGKTELPMSAGYIYSTIPSNYDSYKLGVSTKIIGTITNDDITGIRGEIGKMPKLIETNITVNSNKFHYKIAKEKRLLPFLFGLITANSVSAGYQSVGEVTATIDMHIASPNEKFTNKNIYVGDINTLSREITGLFGVIQDNPFQKLEINEIAVNFSISDTVKFAKIEGLWADKSTVEINDSLNLIVSLSTYKGGIVKQSILIQIPSYVSNDDLWLSVESGRTASTKNISKISSLDELKKWLTDTPANNELVVSLVQKDKNGQVLGKELQSLPPSIGSFFTEPVEGKSKVFEKRIKTEWVLAGEKTIKLNVK
ncbi:MAG: hypothetical protein PHX21_02130 [bacterium]|nr:hypothetical protein [bacterium]